uniref:hypothetical protein n=1 Tax=Microbispora cellulosiformans TaxID=2614688 RepID=UPI001CDA0FCF
MGAQRPGARHRAGAEGDRHPAKTAGSTSLSRGDPIERAWRDAHVGRVHWPMTSIGPSRCTARASSAWPSRTT